MKQDQANSLLVEGIEEWNAAKAFQALNLGATPNKRGIFDDDYYGTALHFLFAAYTKQKDREGWKEENRQELFKILDLLLGPRGANPFLPNLLDEDALLVAAMTGDSELVAHFEERLKTLRFQLLKAQPIPKLDADMRLECGIANNKLSLVQMSVNDGADINAMQDNGWADGLTPLNFSIVEHGYSTIFKYLTALPGIDPYAKDKYGYNAFYAAQGCSDGRCLQLLENNFPANVVPLRVGLNRN